MQVAVWDTYVIKSDRTVMHFDIIVPAVIKDEATVHKFGKEYLACKNQQGQSLTARECSFCHVETADDFMITGIQQQGYFIIEMENCQ